MLKSVISDHKQLISRLARLGISVGLLIYVFLTVDLRNLFLSIIDVDLWLLGVGILLVWLSWSAMAARWHILLWALGWQLRLVDTWIITQTSQFYSLFLPGQVGGEISRWAKVVTQVKQSGTDVAVSIVMDRLVGLSAQILIGSLALVLYKGSTLNLTVKLIVWGLALGNLVLWIGILIGLDRALPAPVQNLLAQLADRIGLLERTLTAIKSYQGKSTTIGASTIVAMIGHGLSALNKVVIAAALHLSIPPLELVLVYIVVSILVMIPVTISGMGLREASYIGLLNEFGHTGDSVTAIPLISFALVVFSALTLGGTLELIGSAQHLLSSGSSTSKKH